MRMNIDVYGNKLQRKCYQCRKEEISDDPLQQYCKDCLPGDSFWNNRFVKAKGYAAVFEVHYDKKGKIEMISAEPKTLVGNNPEDLMREFEQVANMFLYCNPAMLSQRQFILNYDEIIDLLSKKQAKRKLKP